jgi:predicted transcriptional regulator
MPAGGIGEQELALLRYVADRGGSTVGEAAETFAAPRGLARSTVLTMMERLRRKRYLNRRSHRGVYRYQVRTPPADVLRGLVHRFVEGTLGGSVSPFVAYLSDQATSLSEEEIRQLEHAVARLQAVRRGERR